MPSGRTHLRIESMMLVLWGGGAALLLFREAIAMLQALLFVGSYLFSMLLMSPDLDLSSSGAFQRWGGLRWIWLPYAWIFHHRQTSHHPLLGPLSRILYLGTLGAAVTLVYVLARGGPNPRLRVSIQMIWPVCLGLYLPNIEHILADRILTAWRRKRRRRQL